MELDSSLSEDADRWDAMQKNGNTELLLLETITITWLRLFSFIEKRIMSGLISTKWETWMHKWWLILDIEKCNHIVKAHNVARSALTILSILKSIGKARQNLNCIVEKPNFKVVHN